LAAEVGIGTVFGATLGANHGVDAASVRRLHIDQSSDRR
jgi:hypothetical protein